MLFGLVVWCVCVCVCVGKLSLVGAGMYVCMLCDAMRCDADSFPPQLSSSLLAAGLLRVLYNT